MARAFETKRKAERSHPDALVDAYRRYWSTPETAAMETFQEIHREIDRLEQQVGIDESWCILETEAKAWHRDSGICPFCRKRGELHFEGKRI